MGASISFSLLPFQALGDHTNSSAPISSIGRKNYRVKLGIELRSSGLHGKHSCPPSRLPRLILKSKILRIFTCTRLISMIDQLYFLRLHGDRQLGSDSSGDQEGEVEENAHMSF